MQIRLNALNSKAFTKKTFILKIERFQAETPTPCSLCQPCCDE